MVQVFIPTQLQSYCDGASKVAARGDSVDSVLRDLDRQFPGIRFRVIDEQDRIRRHMRIYVGQTMAKDISVAIAENDEMLLFGALSGG